MVGGAGWAARLSPSAPSLRDAVSDAVIRRFMPQRARVLAHLRQGPSLLAGFDRPGAQPGGKPDGEVMEQAWGTPCTTSGFIYFGSNLTTNREMTRAKKRRSSLRVKDRRSQQIRVSGRFRVASDAPAECQAPVPWRFVACRGRVRSPTRVLREYGIFKPFRLLIREQMASSGFDCGVVVAVELHAQLDAFPAAFHAMPIGVA